MTVTIIDKSVDLFWKNFPYVLIPCAIYTFRLWFYNFRITNLFEITQKCFIAKEYNHHAAVSLRFLWGSNGARIAAMIIAAIKLLIQELIYISSSLAALCLAYTILSINSSIPQDKDIGISKVFLLIFLFIWGIIGLSGDLSQFIDKLDKLIDKIAGKGIKVTEK
jgi:hypothetical protein